MASAPKVPQPDPYWKQLGFGSEDEYRSDQEQQKNAEREQRQAELDAYRSAMEEQSRLQREAIAAAASRQEQALAQARKDQEAAQIAEEQRQANKVAAAAAERDKAKQRLRRGRRSTILTGGQGLLGEDAAATVSKKTLLGA